MGAERLRLRPLRCVDPGNAVLALARFWADNRDDARSGGEFADSCLRVRYEEMATDPEETAAGRFRFLGVQASARDFEGVLLGGPRTLRAGGPQDLVYLAVCRLDRPRLVDSHRLMGPPCWPGSTSWPASSATCRWTTTGAPQHRQRTCAFRHRAGRRHRVVTLWPRAAQLLTERRPNQEPPRLILSWGGRLRAGLTGAGPEISSRGSRTGPRPWSRSGSP